jgi:hypothetical protein
MHWPPGEWSDGENMLDAILIAATVAFFAVSLAYVRVCDHL